MTEIQALSPYEASRLAGAVLDSVGSVVVGKRDSLELVLAGILAGASCVVVGNTGPAHLAAAVGTPVVSLFAPTVPDGQWGPYRVPNVRRGAAGAPCRDSRAAVCPVPGHPCLSAVGPAEVRAAVELLIPAPRIPSRTEVAA